MQTKEELKQIVYSSWTENEWTDEELDFIIKNECRCNSCDKHLSDLDDFPEIDIENDELLCEHCYAEHYRVTCPICENSYDIKEGTSDYSVLNESDARDERKTPGIYHNDELIVPIEINKLKRIQVGDRFCEVWSDPICAECVDKLVRKDNYIKSDGVSILLLKHWESNFHDWSKEKLKSARIKLIHERITSRGIIEIANHKIS
jgi:hypothetical protein